MKDLILWIGTCLTVYRITRLIVTDKIFEKQRIYLYRYLVTQDIRKIDYINTSGINLDAWRTDRNTRLSLIAQGSRKEPLTAYMLGCPWCMSIWIGAIVTEIVWIFSDVPYPLLLWPTTSVITGMIATIVKD